MNAYAIVALGLAFGLLVAGRAVVKAVKQMSADPLVMGSSVQPEKKP